MRDIKRILIIEDDPHLLPVLRELLESERYLVHEARDGQEVSHAMAENQFDLITLDLGLPGVSGVELAREICLSSDTPLIVVSARSEIYDRIIALELGADDYITKPFDGREFVARVRAVLRRSAPALHRRAADKAAQAALIAFHDFLLDTQTRKLKNADGATTALTTAECQLLEVLVEKAGRVCTRDEITSRMKGRTWSPLDRSLDTLVARLRKKIEPDPDQPAVVMSVRGIGYMMTIKAGRT